MTDHAASTASPRVSSSLRGVVQWVLAVAAVFAVVAVAMSLIARRVPVGAPGTFGAAADDSVAAAPAGSSYPAPDFRLATLDGGTLGPPDLAGKVVLIDFWATWCGPCRIQAKFIEQLHGELAGKGVEFLAIDVGEDPEAVRSFVAQTPFPYPVLLDPDDTLSQRYQITGLPTVMIVNREGQVTFMNTGVTPVQKLRKELAAAGA